MVVSARLHVSVADFAAIGNPRLIPQQGVSLVTNVDDVESYIISRENDKQQYLLALDLPILDRDNVINELRHMGITAGSLFPGLDGACEDLRQRHFGDKP